jgi:hypothetical protein
VNDFRSIIKSLAKKRHGVLAFCSLNKLLKRAEVRCISWHTFYSYSHSSYL